MLFELNYFHSFIIALGFKLYPEGPHKKLTKLQLCNESDTTYPKELLGHLFCRRENGQNGHSVIVEVSQYYEAERTPDSGWSELIEADLTLDVSFLRIVMNATNEIIQDYLKWRNIRNTQIAHFSGKENAIKLDDILKFYNQIIVPVIEKFHEKY